jgi:sulfatase maturation enzyme AslB (radical SAM superfamily)
VRRVFAARARDDAGRGSEPCALATSRDLDENDLMLPVHLSGSYRPAAHYPSAIVNVTNRCNLSCRHCFVFREGNPNEAPAKTSEEPTDEEVLATLAHLRDRHGILSMLWMGGEPLLRKSLLEKGIPLFQRNTITTNGTVPLVDFGPRVLYVVSLDGPEDLNDAIRGKGVYRRVMRTLSRIPDGFSSPVQVQAVVTRKNQDRLEELVEAVRATREGWMTFSFYVPRKDDHGEDVWETNEERAVAVHEVMRLKAAYPGFVRNSSRSLELMLPESSKRVTDTCPAKELILPLYMEKDGVFTTPFCCYGNDVDCDRCGAWVVFHLAAKLESGRMRAAATEPTEGSV